MATRYLIITIIPTNQLFSQKTYVTNYYVTLTKRKQSIGIWCCTFNYLMEYYNLLCTYKNNNGTMIKSKVQYFNQLLSF